MSRSRTGPLAVSRGGGGTGRDQATGAHLAQLVALLLELLQGSQAGLLLLLEREDVTVEAEKTGDMRWGPGILGCAEAGG